MHDVGLVLDPRFKQHVTGPDHPERPARIDAITAGLETAGLVAACRRIDVQPCERRDLLRVHCPAYLERLESASNAGLPFIDEPDSAICPVSCAIAKLAAGGVVAAARAVGRGEVRRAFCAVRPPGHHCEADRSMGFCLYNNIALAARVLLDEFKLQRVLILDWDVHHGNGTQHIFEADARVLFVSLHEHPSFQYPGTGFEDDGGVGAGAGFTMNIPFFPGSGDAEYRAAFDERVAPKVAEFAPEVILISAGFDAHADDPLGRIALIDESYIWMLRRLLAWAGQFCQQRVISVLEGGYDLGVLRRCVADHVRMLLNE